MTVIASYVYCENGVSLARVDRVEPGRAGRRKEFIPYLGLPEGGFAKKPGLKGKKLPLCFVDEVRAAIDAGATTYLVEGEGKALALRDLLRKADFAAAVTTLFGGANATLTDAHLASLSDATNVVVLADSDDAGRKAATARAQRIVAEYPACDVRLVDLYPDRCDGSDVADWLAGGHKLDDLRALVDCAPRITAALEIQASSEDEGDDQGELVTVCATDVRAQRITWFAPDRIPFSGLTLFDGPGGIGKTTTLAGIIAAGSVGVSFLDGQPIEPVTSLVVAEEDGLGRLKMLLQAAGANLSRVHFVTGVKVGDTLEPVALPRHVPYLERKIVEIGARLVYVDALFSHLELDGDGRMPQQVRRALRPIVEMADRTGVAFTALRHQTKANGSAMQRALGSGELSNVARSVLSFGHHPDDEGLYVLAVAKLNWAAKAPALTYRIEAVTATDDNGESCEVTRVVLNGEAEGITADDLAMRQPGDPDERNAAQDWLGDYLSDGEWHASSDVYKAARKDGAGSGATIRRAASRLGVERDRSGFPARSKWRLPAVRSQIAHSQSVSEPEQSGEQTESAAPPATEEAGESADALFGYAAQRIPPPRPPPTQTQLGL
jgi:AAA domain/Toprim-like